MDKILEQIELNERKNELLSEVICILNEEKGIARQVINLTDEIKWELVDDIKNSPSLPYNMNEVTYKRGSLDEMTFIDKKINIKWEYYSAVSANILNKILINKPTCYCQKTSYNTYTIFILIKAIKGKYEINRIFQSLQHEIQHLWETSHRNKSYKNMDVYNYGKELMKYNNKEAVMIGRILYFSQQWEQRAYENGTYQFLMNHPRKFTTRENIKESELFLWTYEMKNAVECLSKINEPEQHPFIHVPLKKLKRDFNLTFNDIINIGKQAFKNGIRELGRVLTKVEDDMEKQQEFPSFDTYTMLNKKYK